MPDPERIAQAFHEAYERLAPDHAYATRVASAVPWDEVPERNRGLMVATVADLLERGVIADPTDRQPDHDVTLAYWESHLDGGGTVHCGGCSLVATVSDADLATADDQLVRLLTERLRQAHQQQPDGGDRG